MNNSSLATRQPFSRAAQNAIYTIIILLVAIVPSMLLFGISGYNNNQPGLFIIAGTLLIVAAVDIACLRLARQGQSDTAMLIVMVNFIIAVTVSVLIVQGLGLIVFAATLFTLVGISAIALNNRFSAWGILGAVIAATGLFALDSILPAGRMTVPQLESFTPYVVGFLAAGFALLSVREFNFLSIRIKIALGILVTGGITVGVLTVAGLSNAASIIQFINTKYNAAVRAGIQQNLTNQIKNESSNLDSAFAGILTDLSSLADYRSRLATQEGILPEDLTLYGDPAELLVQTPSGAYKYAAGSASVFIPSFIEPDENLIKELNLSLFLDFYAPDFIKRHPEIAAVYFIHRNGTTVYYPDINLAENVPANLDPRKETFYTVAAPENNPTREAKRTPVYVDPAGQGLIITYSIPVYAGENFIGVMSVDINVGTIANRVSASPLAQTGYLILTDQAGHILAMPENAYPIYGLTPGSNTTVDFFRESLLTRGSFELQVAASRAINGETSSSIIVVNDTPHVVAFTPLTISNFRLLFISPLSNFNSELINSDREVRSQVQASLQNIFIILAALFIGAVLISIAMGQVITRPLVNLANVTSQIAEGNFNVRATADTEDESGSLAKSFNIMTERIKNLLAGLEERVNERTKEIAEINQKNFRRASLYEAITRISRVISQSQSLDVLLPLIAENISRQFEVYHVGIFLLDASREQAVLVASNSEGGQRMLARKHSLEVGETGIVGFVTKTGQARIALDVGKDVAFFNNPDLPNTRSEIALPLIASGEIIGALDVQSEQPNAFSEEDIKILSTLADQVAVAIQNARAYQQTQEALARAESLSSDLSRKAWREFSQQNPVGGYHFDGVEIHQINKGSATKTASGRSIAIPLILRGTQIGTLRLSASDPNRSWSDDEVALAQAAADRTALALENARLLQEAQKRAAKERTIGEITSKIGGLVNLDSIIQTTLRELGSTLPDADIAVQFTKE